MADFGPSREPICPAQSQPLEAPHDGAVAESPDAMPNPADVQAGAPVGVPPEAFEGWPPELPRIRRFTESVTDLACIAAHQLGITLSRTDELMVRGKEFIDSKQGVAVRAIGVVAASGAAIGSIRFVRQHQERPKTLFQRVMS